MFGTFLVVRGTRQHPAQYTDPFAKPLGNGRVLHLVELLVPLVFTGIDRRTGCGPHLVTRVRIGAWLEFRRGEQQEGEGKARQDAQG